MSSLSLRQRYTSAVVDAFGGPPSAPQLLPLALVQACVAVLPIDGAGLSVTQTLRVPLSASNPAVAEAERLQTTLGEGPCLTAASAGAPVVADHATMAERWPLYHSLMLTKTPFRSVASLPLRSLGQALGFAALDLYSIDPDAAAFADIAEIRVAVADEAAAALLATPEGMHSMGVALPLWLINDLSDNRMNVWIAVGMICERASLTDADSLAVLRAYAYSNDLTLDEVATRMVTGTLRARDVLHH